MNGEIGTYIGFKAKKRGFEKYIFENCNPLGIL